MNWITITLIIAAIAIDLIAFKHLESIWEKCKALGCKPWIKTTLEIIILLAMLGLVLYGVHSIHEQTAKARTLPTISQ